MRYLFHTFVSVLIAFYFIGCGELSFHLHPNHQELGLITMKVGETKLAITQENCTSLVGGYFPGIISENPEVISVTKVKIPCGHKTTLFAHKKGIVTLCYVPVLVEGTDMEKHSLEKCDKRFSVHVE